MYYIEYSKKYFIESFQKRLTKKIYHKVPIFNKVLNVIKIKFISVDTLDCTPLELNIRIYPSMTILMKFSYLMQPLLSSWLAFKSACLTGSCVNCIEVTFEIPLVRRGMACPTSTGVGGRSSPFAYSINLLN